MIAQIVKIAVTTVSSYTTAGIVKEVIKNAVPEAPNTFVKVSGIIGTAILATTIGDACAKHMNSLVQDGVNTIQNNIHPTETIEVDESQVI